MRVYFNYKRQWIECYFHDVSPNTFERHDGGRWAYFVESHTNSRSGLFGEIHFVATRVRHDVVAHELLHAFLAWIRATDRPISTHNEEHLCKVFDEMTRHFWREYDKENP